MSSNDRKYYRIDDLPASVDEEFRSVTDQSGIPFSKGLIAILRHVDLGDAIRNGQNQLGEIDPDEETRQMGVFVPGELKQEIVEAADHAGIKVGHVGRLILIGIRDRIPEALQEGISAKIQAAKA